MNGTVIVIACILVLAFFSARSTVRRIRAELRGECTCSDCGGCAGCGKSGEECRACMIKMEELKKLREKSSKCPDKDITSI